MICDGLVRTRVKELSFFYTSCQTCSCSSCVFSVTHKYCCVSSLVCCCETHSYRRESGHSGHSCDPSSPGPTVTHTTHILSENQTLSFFSKVKSTSTMRRWSPVRVQHSSAPWWSGVSTVSWGAECVSVWVQIWTSFCRRRPEQG